MERLWAFLFGTSFVINFTKCNKIFFNLCLVGNLTFLFFITIYCLYDTIRYDTIYWWNPQINLRTQRILIKLTREEDNATMLKLKNEENSCQMDYIYNKFTINQYIWKVKVEMSEIIAGNTFPLITSFLESQMARRKWWLASENSHLLWLISYLVNTQCLIGCFNVSAAGDSECHVLWTGSKNRS